MLVLRERPHRMPMRTIVPMRGASLEWVVHRVLTFLKETGLLGSSVALKSKSEFAIVPFLGETNKRKPATCFPKRLQLLRANRVRTSNVKSRLHLVEYAT